MTKYQNNVWLQISLLSVIVLFIYLPGLNSQFQFDDYPNIVINKGLHLQSLSIEDISKASLSGNSSTLKRPVSMFTFALNYYFSKLNPFPYKITNLFIHILNSLSIFWLSSLLLKKTARNCNHKYIGTTAFLISLAWAVHPINLTSVLYIVQRMTSLSAFFTILAMISYIYAKDNIRKGEFKRGTLILFGIFGLAILSILSKENGALLSVYLLLIESFFYQGFFSHNKTNRQITYFFFSISLFIPLTIVCCYTLFKPEWITAGYAGTAFTLVERLLTEFRIIWLYILWILLPNNQSLGLFHDDIPLSSQLFDNTLPFLAGLGHFIVIVFLISLALKKKYPLFVFGCSFFYASHLIESTVLPLELIHEHRNYLGSFALLFGFFSMVLHIPPQKVKPFILASIIYIVFLLLLTTQRSISWGNGLENALIEVHHHPKSAAAHYELGRQYSSINSKEFQEKSLFHFQISSQLDHMRADGLFSILVTRARNNLPIEPKLIEEIKNRLKNGPAYASHPNWLSTLIKCYTNNKCLSLQESDIASILQAALDNKNLHHNKLTESFTLLAVSGFLTSGGHNYQNALELSTIAAKSSSGNVIFIENIINLALHFKDAKTANDWIKIYEAQPYAYFSGKEILSLKNKLSDIRPNK